MEQNQLRLVTQSCCIQQLFSCAIILSVYDVNLNNWSGQLIVFSLVFTRTRTPERRLSKAQTGKAGKIHMYTWQLPDLRRLGWDRARP